MASSAEVEIRCLKCKHQAVLEVAAGTSLATLSRKLVCTKCGSGAMMARHIYGEAKRPMKQH